MEYLNFVAKIHRMPRYPWQCLNFLGQDKSFLILIGCLSLLKDGRKSRHTHATMPACLPAIIHRIRTYFGNPTQITLLRSPCLRKSLYRTHYRTAGTRAGCRGS